MSDSSYCLIIEGNDLANIVRSSFFLFSYCGFDLINVFAKKQVRTNCTVTPELITDNNSSLFVYEGKVKVKPQVSLEGWMVMGPEHV